MNDAAALFSEDVRSAVALGLRLFVGAMWLVAAAAKLRDPVSMRERVSELVGRPAVLAPLIASILPVVEAVLGVLLLAAVATRTVAAISVALLVCFTVLIVRAAVRHTLITGGCGCFGVLIRSRGERHDMRGTSLAMARNLVLAAMAAAIASHG
jgi:uncharacterized membrane protein YphA (DoxX/SURF4 family)